MKFIKLNLGSLRNSQNMKIKISGLIQHKRVKIVILPWFVVVNSVIKLQITETCVKFFTDIKTFIHPSHSSY
jgi:hypothetical protein